MDPQIRWRPEKRLKLTANGEGTKGFRRGLYERLGCDSEMRSGSALLALRFLEDTGGKYVAVREKRIVAASSTMKELYRKLDELNPGMVLITKFFDSKTHQ